MVSTIAVSLLNIRIAINKHKNSLTCCRRCRCYWFRSDCLCCDCDQRCTRGRGCRRGCRSSCRSCCRRWSRCCRDGRCSWGTRCGRHQTHFIGTVNISITISNIKIGTTNTHFIFSSIIIISGILSESFTTVRTKYALNDG